MNEFRLDIVIRLEIASSMVHLLSLSLEGGRVNEIVFRLEIVIRLEVVIRLESQIDTL